MIPCVTLVLVAVNVLAVIPDSHSATSRPHVGELCPISDTSEIVASHAILAGFELVITIATIPPLVVSTAESRVIVGLEPTVSDFTFV